MRTCKYARGAGSYYDLLPWNECAKLPSNPVIGGYDMCYVDAGVECPFETKENSDEQPHKG